MRTKLKEENVDLDSQPNHKLLVQYGFRYFFIYFFLSKNVLPFFDSPRIPDLKSLTDDKRRHFKDGILRWTKNPKFTGTSNVGFRVWTRSDFRLDDIKYNEVCGPQGL